MSAFVVSGIAPSLKIDSSQRLVLGWEESPEPLGKFSIDNIFVPTSLAPSVTKNQIRNNLLSGYRWIHETAEGETYGTFKLQKFLTDSPTGIDILVFNDDGSFSIPGTTDAKFIVQTADSDLPNAQSLGALTTGLLKNTVTAGTGVLSTAISGTDYATLGHTLNQFAVPTTSLNLNSQKIINVLDPTNAQDVATKAYVDLAAVNVANAKFIIQTTDADLPNAQILGALTTGLLKNTTTTGVLSTAVIGTDYYAPNGADNIVIQTATNGTSYFKSGDSTKYLRVGYDGSSLRSVIEMINHSGLFIKKDGTTICDFSVGGGGATFLINGTILANGGVQTITGEDSSIKATGNSTSTKIEIENLTAITGRFYELRSNSDGTFGIFDRTSAASRLSFATTGVLNLTNNSVITITNGGGIPLYEAGTTSGDHIQIGYDGSNDYSFINIAGSSNDRLAFRVGGVGIAALLSSGLFGIGTISPSGAKLVVNGGVQNQANEETAIRVISALNNVKIELQATGGSGKLYELRSSNTGGFDITDRTGAATRFAITSGGNVGIGMGTSTPNGKLQLSNTLTNRQFVLWEGANNDHQYHGFGSISGGLRYNIVGTADRHIFYAGVNSTTSNELMRIQGNGIVAIGNTADATTAKLHILGGVQNQTNEESALRIAGALNNIKMELHSTGGSGRVYSIRSTNAGLFQIYDETGTASRIVLLSTGEVGIGTTAPDNLLTVNGTANKPGGGSWGSFSDGRIKDIMGQYTHGLNEILKINPTIYKYNEKSDLPVAEREQERIGIIAQEIEEILPECIELRNTKGFSDLRYFDSSAILYTLINAIKELNNKIENLKSIN